MRKRNADTIIKGIKMTEKSEKSILHSIAYSPVIVSVYLNSKVWKDYQSGFITSEACEKKKINHAVSYLCLFYMA